MRYLAHYNRYQNAAYGIWYLPTSVSQPLPLYLDPQSPVLTRATAIVWSKLPSVSWDEWLFSVLPSRDPNFESWVAYDAMGMTPREFLKAFAPSQQRVA